MPKQIETKVRDALSAAGKPLPPDTIVKKVKGVSPDQVRDAIWSLLAQGTLMVTADWKLKELRSQRSRPSRKTR